MRVPARLRDELIRLGWDLRAPERRVRVEALERGIAALRAETQTRQETP